MARLTKREGKHTIRIGNEWRRDDPVWEKLAQYEDLEEAGRLIVLSIQDTHPCSNCGVGWGSASAKGVTSCHDTCERLKKYVEDHRYD